MGPSNTAGAPRPSRRSAAITGAVVGLPVTARRVIAESGAARAAAVAPEQIGRHAAFIEKVTYCRASWSGCPSRHRRRSAATAGRRCSSAYTVFFNGEAQSIDFQPQRAPAPLSWATPLGVPPTSRRDRRRSGRPVAPPGRPGPATETWFADAARSEPVSRRRCTNRCTHARLTANVASDLLRVPAGVPRPHHPRPQIHRIRRHRHPSAGRS